MDMGDARGVHDGYRKVLIGDGHSASRSILRDLLYQQDYEIVGEATNWGNFLPMAKCFEPDIIYLDQSIPGANIPHFLQEMRIINPEIAVIIMSSNPANRDKIMSSGAAGFLEKPFSQTQVIEGLAQIDQAYWSSPETKTQPAGICTGLRAVLADNCDDMRQHLKTLLEEMGVKIIGEAVDGQQAIIMAAQHQPDVICLDAEMPAVNGIDALAKIHADHPGIKAIMVTSRADRNTVMRAISLGACGYILKPYKADQVGDALRKVMRYGLNRP